MVSVRLSRSPPSLPPNKRGNRCPHSASPPSRRAPTPASWPALGCLLQTGGAQARHRRRRPAFASNAPFPAQSPRTGGGELSRHLAASLPAGRCCHAQPRRGSLRLFPRARRGRLPSQPLPKTAAKGTRSSRPPPHFNPNAWKSPKALSRGKGVSEPTPGFGGGGGRGRQGSI